MDRIELQDILSKIGVNVDKARTILRTTIEGYDLCERPKNDVVHILSESIEAIYILLEAVDDYCDNAENLIENLQTFLDEKGGVAVG